MNAGEAGLERVRLFVALDLPSPAREAIEQWGLRALGGRAALRPGASDGLHVTLCFLGWRSLHEIDPIAAACVRALAGRRTCELSLLEGLWLPQRRPRVLAVHLGDESGALAAVQASLSATLSAGGWYAPEPRQFLPHVTVARARARVRAFTLPRTPELSFCAESVTLYRSRPGAAGARYEALHKIQLGRKAARLRGSNSRSSRSSV